MDDDELIAATARGDDGALRELFVRHAPWLAGRLRRLLPAASVEDVLQETFLAVWRGAGKYSAQGIAGAWLWGIARRQAASWLRRNARVPPPEPLPEDADPADRAVRRTDLASAVGSLSGPERELWRLLYEEDRSVADVAGRLGIPHGTVKSRAHHVRRLLRAALGQEDT